MTTRGGREAQHNSCPKTKNRGKIGRSFLLLQPAASQFWPIRGGCGVGKAGSGAQNFKMQWQAKLGKS